MTKQKHFKERVRARMARPAKAIPLLAATYSQPKPKANLPWLIFPTFPVPILRQRPCARPWPTRVSPIRTGEFFSEPMVFGIAGGVGAGVFHFYYAAEDFASFYIAGRHRWQESDAYLVDACRRFGVTPSVLETGAKKRAATQLAEAVAATGCAVAWVDMGFLPYRGMSTCVSGGGYHVITSTV